MMSADIAIAPSQPIQRVTPGEDAVTVAWQDGSSETFHHLWLRDNCRCSRCLHPNGQRLIDVLDLPLDSAPAAVAVDDSGALVIRWNNGGHESRYPAEWLRAHSYSSAARVPRRPTAKLWDAKLTPPQASWPEVSRDPDLERRWLEGLLDTGFALLRNVPVKPGMVAEVGDHIGFVRTTNYGRIFDVISKPDPNNLAYTGMALGVHTDNPYRDPTPGYQLLHCLIADAPGGDTLLVDGYATAQIMRAEDPKSFELLASIPRPFRFADAISDLRARFPVIGLDADGAVKEIHFNNRSVAPLDIAAELVIPYMKAYRRFAQILARPELTLLLHLEPGDLIVMENGRALHGRSAFDPNAGARHLQGCYVDKDGLESRYRVLSRGVTP
jgi:gamma-butyrobetaine dioxygenase